MGFLLFLRYSDLEIAEQGMVMYGQVLQATIVRRDGGSR